jgi:hypothetical protein
MKENRNCSLTLNLIPILSRIHTSLFSPRPPKNIDTETKTKYTQPQRRKTHREQERAAHNECQGFMRQDGLA